MNIEQNTYSKRTLDTHTLPDIMGNGSSKPQVSLLAESIHVTFHNRQNEF